MIKYRPHRGSLENAMREMKTFNSKEEMFDYIVKDWGGFISYADLSITENIGRDKRIDWKECRHVCAKRINSETFKVPQCIGMCSIED